jgi:hypothetical protein
MDPIGMQGRHKPISDLDLAELGGDNFFERLKVLAKVKEDAAKALAELKLGEDIVALHQNAERTLRAAENAKADADAYSAKVRREADDYVTVVRQDADNYAAEIDAAKAQVEEAKQCALAAEAEVKQNKAELERLIAENIEKQRALDAKTAKFKSGLLELKREFSSDGDIDKLSVPPFTEGELQALEQKPMQAN